MASTALTIRSDTHIERPHLLNAYLNHMTDFLHSLYGDDIPADEYESFVKTVVRKKIHRPTVDVVVHDSPGNARMETKDLLKHTGDISTKIILPAGTVYKPSTEAVSFLKEMIVGQKKRRKSSKKLMLKYQSENNQSKTNYYNSDQTSQKISMNAIPGAMGSAYSFLSDIAGFNSVTSTGRYFIMSSYANAERFLEGNYYFPTVESIVNYCQTVFLACPPADDVRAMLQRYDIAYVEPEDVIDFLEAQYTMYKRDTLPMWFKRWIDSIDRMKLSYLYYLGNLKHLIQKNEARWRAWMAVFFEFNDSHLREDIKGDYLRSIDGDLIIILSTVFNDWLPTIDDKKTNIYDTIDSMPELAWKLACAGKHMETIMDELTPLMEFFMDTHLTFTHVFQHKNMYRKCVIGSDTDSIIFTTKNWLQWYSGDLRIHQQAYQINSLVVYWLSKSNAYLMRTIALHRGALKEDKDGIAMKNEFFYPVMSLSSLKKHYAALMMIREGTVLPKMISDIKGVNYRGSSLCGVSLGRAKSFIDSTHEAIVRDGKISAIACIDRVLEFERFVYDSLVAGETQFLPIKPIRNAEDYSNDNSLYYNYQFWEAVFAPKYGSIDIPGKCYIAPIEEPAKVDGYFAYLEEHEPEMFARMKDFLDTHKRKLTRVPINPRLEKLPEELIPIMRMKSIILNNCAPQYLYLSNLGISVGNGKQPVLFSDVYAPSQTKMVSPQLDMVPVA